MQYIYVYFSITLLVFISEGLFSTKHVYTTSDDPFWDTLGCTFAASVFWLPVVLFKHFMPVLPLLLFLMFLTVELTHTQAVLSKENHQMLRLAAVPEEGFIFIQDKETSITDVFDTYSALIELTGHTALYEDLTDDLKVTYRGYAVHCLMNSSDAKVIGMYYELP